MEEQRMEDRLRGEITALLDEAVPAPDLGLCFSYTLPGEGFETCQTYDEIYEKLEKLGISVEP